MLLGVRGIMCYYARMDVFGDHEDYFLVKDRHTRSLLNAGSVVAKLKEGIDTAGKLLGLNTAQGVAHLVSSSLLRTRPMWLREGSDTTLQHGIFSGFFRLLGLDSTKLGAIALNAIIFIAQLISNSLVPQIQNTSSGRSHHQQETKGTPVSWILDNPSAQMGNLLKRAQDEFLPDKVIRSIQDRYSDDESGCIQLLVCKTSPFVWGMQKSVRALLRGNQEDRKGWNRLTPIQIMYNDLPSVKEITEYGDNCEDRFPTCKIMPSGLH
ncbi:hypothetical protein L9F63_001102 [Diploptera punctata]|uniref:Uncharacterized protein n=1 Tax=Diploptera punctata TaxID=6984 RepID=A0AAD8ET58_DIPPU|nr:hypothetical protein L9F63_001102 [Diploptera punctata]